jgi:Tol biopolymer transport system component
MKTRRSRRLATTAITVTVAASAFGGTLLAQSAEAAATKVERVSLGANGKQANAYSLLGAVTPNGRYVLFLSSATNLVKGDSNGNQELYRRDTVTGKTVKVTWSADHGEASSSMVSGYNGISANGRYVVFDSFANNLVAGDTNNTNDVFVRDMKTGVTKRVSVKGGQGGGEQPSISADGRRVAFASGSTEFVPRDTNETKDIFVKDLKTNKFTRVSVSSKGEQSDHALPPSNSSGPATHFDDRHSESPLISGDGNTVAFASYARNLVPKDTNAASDVFLHNLRSGKTTLASVKTDGSQASNSNRGYGSTPLSISADGRVVVMTGAQADLAGPTGQQHQFDTYVRNLRTHVTSRVNARADGKPTKREAGEAFVSPDGRYLAFASTEPNVKRGYTGTVRDIFIRDLKTNKLKVVSVTGTSKVPDGVSYHFVLTTKAKAVVFESNAGNLVGGDTNGVKDIFKRKL